MTNNIKPNEIVLNTIDLAVIYPKSSNALYSHSIPNVVNQLVQGINHEHRLVLRKFFYTEQQYKESAISYKVQIPD